MNIVSSFIPFPPITWWSFVLKAEELLLDKAEHFEKMSYRNKYAISGANNPIQLSVPLVKGRNQRTPMTDVLIHNEEKWQVQHWRTLVSVYRQTPYWEFYEQSLQHLFETSYTHLTDFNLATLQWTCKQLKLKVPITITDTYLASYPTDTADIRHIKPAKDKEQLKDFPRYYQVFEDRIGFQPNLSILDLLFSEGPMAKGWIEGRLGMQ